MIERARTERWVRWGVLGSAAAMIAALLLTTWWSYRSVRAASETLAKGHGDQLLESVLSGLRALEGRPTEAQLQAVLDDHAASGLRYVALATPRSLIRAGEARGARIPPTNHGPRKRIAMLSGGRVRMEMPGPPPPPHGRRPFGRPPPPDGPRGPRRLPDIAIEFEPLVANALIADAERTRLIGGIAAFGLALFALAMVRWLARRAALEAQGERDARLAQLGEMSAVLAHEIRNPLASLKGHSQLLVERLDGTDDQPKAERVVTEAVRLEHLTNDLLAFAQTGKIERADADPAVVLANAVDDVDPARIDVDAASAPEVWQLDSPRMHQVLTNLLRNAVQASPADARVTATCELHDDALVYCVSDRGNGIDAGQENAIFEPFRTSRTHGTGLGLSVARRLVQLHGGTLTASNRVDGGAELRIELPRTPAVRA